MFQNEQPEKSANCTI